MTALTAHRTVRMSLETPIEVIDLDGCHVRAPKMNVALEPGLDGFLTVVLYPETGTGASLTVSEAQQFFAAGLELLREVDASPALEVAL